MIFGEGPIIKNIAGDLNKLFLQGSRAGQPINNVEGSASADQATAALMADRDPVIRDISTGLGYAGREVTVSGTGALQLVNSLGRPLTSWSVELAPYQEGSGDPSPENVRPIHGTDKITFMMAGKNLLDFIVRSQNGIISTKINGVAHITGTATATTYPVDFVPSVYPAGTYIWSISGLPAGAQCIYTRNGAWAGFVTQGASITITAGVTIGGYITIPTGTSVDTEIKIQLELGNTASDFTPFTAASQTVITLPYTIYNAAIRDGEGEIRTRYRLYNGASSEFWTYSPSWSKTDTAVFYSNGAITDGLFDDYNTVFITNCNLFQPKTRQSLYNYDVPGIGYSGDMNPRAPYLTVRISKTIASTVEEFTAFLASNPIEIVYQLITPVQFTINSPFISTTEGDGVAWVTAEDGIVTNFSATYLQGE